jgi:hypothetical protein
MRPEVLDYELLMKARAIIEDPTKWTKGGLYAKRNGKFCRIQYAEQFCAVGALTMAVRQMGNPTATSRTAMRLRAGKLLRSVVPSSYSNVEVFNDSPFTKHEMVLELFERAAEKAKELATAPRG